MPEKVFNPRLANEAQEKYCKSKDIPHFAPESGICFRCGKNIYEPYERDGNIEGIDVETAGKFLITGCPHCIKSFCD